MVLVGGVTFTILFFVWETLGFTWLAVISEQSTEAAKLSIATSYLGVDPVLWWILSGAGAAAGIMAIGASLGAKRVGFVPVWAGWVGIVLGVVAIAVQYVGVVAWFLWILLTVSVLLRLSRAQTSSVSNSS